MSLPRYSPQVGPHVTALVLVTLALPTDDPRVSSVVEDFGKNVRRLRLAREWTQEDLAHQSGLAVVQISRVERGAREIRLGTLLRLTAALEATPNELLDGLY